jgi:hypothetical protein
MVSLVARQLGQTLLVLWTTEQGLGRKVTAIEGRPGAHYHRETSPGVWRSEHIKGSSKVVYNDLSQLTALVTMLYVRR